MDFTNIEKRIERAFADHRSCVHIYVQFVFTVRQRRPDLTARAHSLLFDSFHRTIAERYGGCSILAVGGIGDHVHLLLRLDGNSAVSELARDLKSRSSRCLKREGAVPQTFRWQSSYGAFTCDYDDLDPVVEYIKNQEAHHRHESPAAELTRLLSGDPEFPEPP